MKGLGRKFKSQLKKYKNCVKVIKMLEKDVVISLGKLEDYKNTNIKNTIKTIESFHCESNETVYTTCENDNLVKFEKDKRGKKRDDVDIFKNSKDNFVKLQKCKNVI